jgi:dihydroorotate dehydrogenase
LFALPPEKAHTFVLNSLRYAHCLKLTRIYFGQLPLAPREVMGLHFPNQVGLAAGMDKNGEYIDYLAALGFGFIEVGTVTPRPQKGNPQPRLFRLPKAQAIINRMGFNNAGVDRVLHNIKRSNFQGILGINIGKNFDTPLEQAMGDYLICFSKVYPYADYITINISSPNTPQLRQLQQGQELIRLLDALKQAQAQLAEQHNKYVPIVVKIAPDLTEAALRIIAEKLLFYDIDGIIATNTTLSRTGVEGQRYADETGGLSGAPLLRPTTQVVRTLNTYLQGQIPIIAAGGILHRHEAQEKFQAGASLVQIYTGLIYRGPRLVKEIATLKQSY